VTNAADAPRFLLATDFDGTISPIVSTPDQARIHPTAERLLQACAASSVAVAIISGRDVSDLRGRIGGVRAILAGSHGLECVDAEGHALWTSERRCPEMPASLLRDLLRTEMHIEGKKYSVALHFRGVEKDTHAHLQRLTSWADEQNLDVIAGRKVVEISVRGGGKRAALRAIAGHVKASRMLYAGDDLTDFPALAFAAAHGRAIFVVNEERDAPAIDDLRRVATIEALCEEFTNELASANAGLQAPARGPAT